MKQKLGQKLGQKNTPKIGVRNDHFFVIFGAKIGVFFFAVFGVKNGGDFRAFLGVF